MCMCVSVLYYQNVDLFVVNFSSLELILVSYIVLEYKRQTVAMLVWFIPALSIPTSSIPTSSILRILHLSHVSNT